LPAAPSTASSGLTVRANDLQGGELVPTLLADVLDTLPRAERRRFNATWRYCREVLDLVDQVIRRPVPGLDQAEQAEELLGYLIWQLRLTRRTIRRARTGT
jgi:hypothetical protein